ncbi:transposase [Streptomyces bambusae]|uniref:IS701 family transposase n=1 Tax=Streptomyces bambusae TaxID=1550616 RepID=UPI001CFCEE75|nr:transposase [Streptomyces bambusae]MCB5165285.1 transposase [Streptomyces bambusae]
MACRVLPEEPSEAAAGSLDALVPLFYESLPRRDQRNWARVYLNGLLSTTGKKTIRNIAGADAGSVEQSLQQFISKSPWDWTPVRRSLARYLEGTVPAPLAWVVRPLVIEKAGDRSVGVGRQFVPQLGRTANCQQANGIWLASGEAGFPVEWSLTLPVPWTSERLRRRAGIPDTARALSPAQDAVLAVLRMASGWELRRRPVVMEVGRTEFLPCAAAFALRGIPFVLKVDGDLPVAGCGSGRARGGPPAAPAREVAAALRGRRRTVEWTRPGGAGGAVTRLAATAVTAAPAADRGSGPAVPVPAPLLLLGAWAGDEPQPGEFWITNVADRTPAQLFLLAKLADRVDLDCAEVCERVGIRDFEGRSFRGWHHHATLASVAHAAAVLGGGRRAAPDLPPAPPHHRIPAAVAAVRAERPVGRDQPARYVLDDCPGSRNGPDMGE